MSDQNIPYYEYIPNINLTLQLKDKEKAVKEDQPTRKREAFSFYSVFEAIRADDISRLVPFVKLMITTNFKIGTLCKTHDNHKVSGFEFPQSCLLPDFID